MTASRVARWRDDVKLQSRLFSHACHGFFGDGLSRSFLLIGARQHFRCVDGTVLNKVVYIGRTVRGGFAFIRANTHERTETYQHVLGILRRRERSRGSARVRRGGGVDAIGWDNPQQNERKESLHHHGRNELLVLVVNL